MKIKEALTKERVITGLKSLGKLRIKVTHDSIITFSALLLILFVAFTIRVFPMRWEIETGSVHLTEFDPYFQYRFTEKMVKDGLLSWIYPQPWIDKQRWYPSGINVTRAGFPGLPFTAAVLYKMVSALGVNIELMTFCALLGPIMGMLACLAIYFLGKDLGGKPMGLLAALFLALSPSYIQRSQAGWFDDEIIGILALLIFIFMFLRAIEDDRPAISTVKYALGAGLALAYFCSGWGAAFYGVGVMFVFVLALILLKRYTRRLLLSYSLTFGTGLFIAINVPKIAPSYLTTIAILPVAGVFLLLCLYEVSRALTSAKWKVIFIVAFLAMLVSGFVVLWQRGYMRDIAGKFISVINPFTRAGSPLVESVAEHRISAWGSIYYEFGIGIIFFIAGLFFILRNLNNKNLFLLIFSLTSLYFACSMVRLFVLMAPAFGLVAAAGIVGILKPFNTLLKVELPKISMKKRHGLERVGKEFSGTAILLIFLILMTIFAFPVPRVYRQVYAPTTITAGSLPIAPDEPIKEWLNMLAWTRDNLEATTVICSWWDYGYWLTIMGNVTTLADNATINTTQIENIGFMFMANETQALKMLKLYNATYILVFTSFDTNGNWAGYGDEGKWMWMARISGKAHKRFVDNGFLDEISAWDDETKFGNFSDSTWQWNSIGMNSTIYKLMSYGKHQWMATNRPGTTDPNTWVEPTYFKEAYFAGLTSSGYGGLVPLVCLYKIEYPDQ